MYNVEQWIETTIQSVKNQNYENFQCVLVDDISTDKTVEMVKTLIKGDKRFKLVQNTEKKFALRNIAEAIEISKPSSDDVIINLDGDDWFPNSNVLSYLNKVYENKDVWMTYGNHMNWPDVEPPWPLFPHPKEVVENNSFRDFRYLASHLRSFKHKLWTHVKKEDLCDDDGEYFKVTADLAIMFPLCELAGVHAKFLDEILYVYNNHNPLNDWRVNAKEQKSVEMLLRTMPRYQPLEKL